MLNNKRKCVIHEITADKHYALQEVINDNQPTQYRKRNLLKAHGILDVGRLCG